MLKTISNSMYKGNFFTRLVVLVGSMVAISVLFYIIYATIFFLVTVLGLGSLLVSGMLGLIVVVTAMIKYPQKQEYSEYAKKRM